MLSTKRFSVYISRYITNVANFSLYAMAMFTEQDWIIPTTHSILVAQVSFLWLDFHNNMPLIGYALTLCSGKTNWAVNLFSFHLECGYCAMLVSVS